MRILVSLFLIAILSTSCTEELIEPQQSGHQDDSEKNQQISYDELPESIQDYLEANYPDLGICEIEVEDDYDDEEDSDDNYFEVLMTNGLELYFDEEGNFLYAEEDDDFEGCEEEDNEESDEENIAFDELPESVQDYLNANYPDIAICEIEMEDDGDEDYVYEVQLTNGLELYFDEDGNFLYSEEDDDFEGCDDSDDDSDNDDDDDDSDDDSDDDDESDEGDEDDGDEDDGDDDGYISFQDLPQAIQDYLNANYPEFSICEIEMENDEDYTYEVSLEGGLELYFDAEGNFLFSEQDDDGDC